MTKVFRIRWLSIGHLLVKFFFWIFMAQMEVEVEVGQNKLSFDFQYPVLLCDWLKPLAVLSQTISVKSLFRVWPSNTFIIKPFKTLKMFPPQCCNHYME